MKLSHLCLGLVVLNAAACKQDREIKVYRVAKETPANPHALSGDPHAGMPGMMPGGVIAETPGGDPHAGLSADQLASVGMGGGPKVSDSPPAHWKKQAGSALRLASYLVEGDGGAVADISLIMLRGAAGGTLANVNRWRGQQGLEPIDEATLQQSAQKVATPLGEAVVVEIVGLSPGADALKDGAMMGAIVDKGRDAWFFKMRGNAALVAAEKDAFLKWIAFVNPAAPAADAVQAETVAETPQDQALTWQVPKGWELQPGSSSMRYGTFTIASSDGTKGEMAVTHFPGDVGGDLGNVNRWRQQVGLEPVDEATMTSLVSTITAGPKKLSFIDITGGEHRLAAGWTRHGEETWFFKLTGPDALVAAELEKFTAFLESVRFNSPE